MSARSELSRYFLGLDNPRDGKDDSSEVALQQEVEKTPLYTQPQKIGLTTTNLQV